jgi:hypothetical protein
MFQKLSIDHSEVLPLSQCKQHVRSDHREAVAYASSLPMRDYPRKLCSCRVNYYD